MDLHDTLVIYLVLLTSQVADILSTREGFKNGLVEANRLLLWIGDRIGKPGLQINEIAAIKGIFIVFALLIYFPQRFVYGQEFWCLWVAASLGWIFAIHNWLLIRKRRSTAKGE